MGNKHLFYRGGIDWIYCSCSNVFVDSSFRTAKMKFKNHLRKERVSDTIIRFHSKNIIKRPYRIKNDNS